MEKKNNSTLLSLIFETFIAIFLSGSSSEDEKSDYNIKDKWKNWANNTFNWVNCNKKLKKIFKICKKCIIYFAVFNIIIFTPIVIGQLKSPRYPVARACLKSSFMVNNLYIIPLSKLFGYGNPLTWPFYPIKESLYKIGLSKLPKTEGEREIWWFNVRFVEYKTVVQPALMQAYMRDTTFKPLPKWQIKSMTKWHNELYSHILSLPNAKISDPIYKKEKLMRFVDLADTYEDSTSVFSTKLQVTKKKYTIENFPNHLPYAKPEDVKNYMNIISVFEKLKTDSAKNDEQSYQYFQKNKRYYEDKFLYETALDLLRSKTQWGPSISCNSPDVNVFVTSNKKLRDFYINNYTTLKPGEKITIEILATLGVILPECKDSKVCEYKEFLKRKRASFHQNMTTLEMFKD